MKKRTQFGVALALVAPAWLVTAHAAEHEGQQTQSQQQMQQQQTQAGSQLMNMTAGEIADMKLKNDQGEEIGDIEKVVQSKTDGKVNAVVSLGGFLGLGEKQVAVPLDQVQVQEGELIAQGMTKDQLEQQQAYNEQEYEEVEESATLASVTEGAVAGGAAQVSFQELDQDQDGNLTPEEIQSGPQQLSQNWQQYDTDQDQQLSQSEFSAFEQEQQAQGGQQQGLAFSDLDQDGDGKISREEIREVKQLSDNWSQYDTNQDDALDQGEFAAFEEEQQQQPGEQQQMMQQQGGEQVSFQQLDQDQDGNLTREEIQSGPQQLSQNWEQYDTDQDSQLSESEFSAFEQERQQGGQQQMMQQQQGGGGGQVSFQQLDQDQDGNITREEAQSEPQLSQNWQQYDTDQDGQLSQSEFSAFEQEQQGQQPGQVPESQMPQEEISPEGQM